MGIISKKDETKIQKPFPKLMINKHVSSIVLFSAKECGVVVVRGGGVYPEGKYMEACDMSYFEDYEGTVSLSNE